MWTASALFTIRGCRPNKQFCNICPVLRDVEAIYCMNLLFCDSLVCWHKGVWPERPGGRFPRAEGGRKSVVDVYGDAWAGDNPFRAALPWTWTALSAVRAICEERLLAFSVEWSMLLL